MAESKRLIAKAVVAMPEVKAAMQHGRLIVGRGSTNAYIVEELLNTYVEKSHYTVGVITAGTLCVTPEDDRMPEVVFVEGLKWSTYRGNRRWAISEGEMFS